eukprot:g80361.t1
MFALAPFPFKYSSRFLLTKSLRGEKQIQIFQQLSTVSNYLPRATLKHTFSHDPCCLLNQLILVETLRIIFLPLPFIRVANRPHDKKDFGSGSVLRKIL